jgi:hypothetical protein
MKIIRSLAIAFFFLPFSIFAAEQVNLTVDGKDYPALLDKVEKNKGGVILFQGESAYPIKIITYLAKVFPAKEWTTLLVKPNKDTDVMTKLLPEAIRLIRKNDTRRIIVLYYGNGYSNLLNYFSQGKAKSVSGVILLSAYSLAQTKLPDLSKWETPVFDVTAQFDYPNVIAQSKQRSDLIKAKYYRHFSIPGASHNYVDVEPVVVSWLRGWMLKQKIEKKRKPPVRPPKLRRR